MNKEQPTFYVAKRRSCEAGEDWLDVSTIAIYPAGAEERAKINDEFNPLRWFVELNPVTEIVPVQIVEIKQE